MTIEFKSFPSVEHLDKLEMRITQKIHGTHAQISIYQDYDHLHVCVGSSNRWLVPDDDNFGFAKFVYDHIEDFRRLGVGTHCGEWAGPGINSGEGLTERTLFLFGHPDRYEGIELPPRVTFVPQLYRGPVNSMIIDACMDNLRINGSRAVPGFMSPEGIVVQIAGKRFKKTFTPEESKWWGIKKDKPKREYEDFGHLLQPLRLEKLLSRDESYIKNYPASLPMIAKDYIADLIKEGQIVGDEDEIARVRKACSREVFWFIKTCMTEKLKC